MTEIVEESKIMVSSNYQMNALGMLYKVDLAGLP